MNNIAAAAATLRHLPSDFLTTREVTLFLRCDRKTVQRMVYSGKLAPLLVGRHWRFDRREIVEALRRKANP
jgi:excisionase family DNA binding protein